MKHHGLAATGVIAGGILSLTLSVQLLHGHFQALKDVREYALPLAAEIAPLERRTELLDQQMELSSLEASLRTDSADEKLHTYVLPAAAHSHASLPRLLAFLESGRTFLERRGLLRSMSAIDVSEPSDIALTEEVTDGKPEKLQARTLRFSAVLKPEGRSHLFSILDLSGMLTVGDVLSPENVQTLFAMTENQNYAAIVPVERFLSSDLLSYIQDGRLIDERMAQALSSEEFLRSFTTLMQSSRLPQVREFLTGDLGRTLVAQKLWPVQFMTIEKESLTELGDGWERVELTVKAYSRK